MSTVIKKIATREAKSLVKSMFWQMFVKNENSFVEAKGCAIVAARRLLMQHNRDVVNKSTRYHVLKALPKAINELKYKK
jgi:hypothetical protein